MKSLRFGLAHLVILAALVSCGKDNESGKKTPFSYTNPYCTPGAYCSPYTNGPISAVHSPIAFANTAQAENPCIGGSYYGSSRVAVQSQLAGLKGVVASGDVYLGVTTYGDVAVIVGNGTNSATLYAYLCPRVGSSGQGYITPPSLGSYSIGCNVKGITAMNVQFPDGQVAAFRDPSFGVRNPYTGQKIKNFSFCPTSTTN